MIKFDETWSCRWAFPTPGDARKFFKLCQEQTDDVISHAIQTMAEQAARYEP